jgi:hypothetical protein
MGAGSYLGMCSWHAELSFTPPFSAQPHLRAHMWGLMHDSAQWSRVGMEMDNWWHLATGLWGQRSKCSVRRAWWGSRFLEGAAFHWAMLARENLKVSLNDQGLHYPLQCQRSCDFSWFHSTAPWNECGDLEGAQWINNSTSFWSGNLLAQELKKWSGELFCPIPKQ